MPLQIVRNDITKQIDSRLFADIAAYIDDRYVDGQVDERSVPHYSEKAFRLEEKAPKAPFPRPVTCKEPVSLKDALKQLDEGFSEMLLRKIDESGMTDAQCYKKANIDRKLFSKIKNNKHYKPSKTTAVALGLALELPMEELKDLLGKAGYSKTHASKFDIIVEYFVEQGNYDVFEINEALFAFDQSLIGA